VRIELAAVERALAREQDSAATAMRGWGTP
jgi:hypothetical protein